MPHRLVCTLEHPCISRDSESLVQRLSVRTDSTAFTLSTPLSHESMVTRWGRLALTIIALRMKVSVNASTIAAVFPLQRCGAWCDEYGAMDVQKTGSPTHIIIKHWHLDKERIVLRHVIP